MIGVRFWGLLVSSFDMLSSVLSGDRLGTRVWRRWGGRAQAPSALHGVHLHPGSLPPIPDGSIDREAADRRPPDRLFVENSEGRYNYSQTRDGISVPYGRTGNSATGKQNFERNIHINIARPSFGTNAHTHTRTHTRYGRRDRTEADHAKAGRQGDDGSSSTACRYRACYCGSAGVQAPRRIQHRKPVQ